jgi:uncharacterized membrane protein YkvA (DUF1232 family)
MTVEFNPDRVPNEEEVEELLDAIDDKSRKGGGRWRQFWSEVAVLGRMARAVQAGDYELATPQIAALIGTLVYVISPVDAIPDTIPVVGLTDDAAVVTAVVASMAVEIACFREWEKTHGRYPV